MDSNSIAICLLALAICINSFFAGREKKKLTKELKGLKNELEDVKKELEKVNASKK